MASFQSDSSKTPLQQRLLWLYGLLGLVFLILVVRLWQLQILQGAEFTLLAERNRVRTIQLVAPRGTVLDRNGMPLVENRSAFNILLYRDARSNSEETRDFILEKLGVMPEDLDARLRRGNRMGLYRPLVVKEDVGIDDISVVEANRRDHPEIQIGSEPRRFYRYGKLAGHVLGYVGEVSDEELKSGSFPGSKPGDLIGKAGTERIYNRQLTGIDGSKQVLVDSIGREVGVYKEQQSIPGGNLRLTLDLRLQRRATKLLDGKVGAIVAMDPRNGEVLVMESAPSFDPNSFSARISAAQWKTLINDPDHPLQNRAIQNSHSPGSIFKVVMAIAGLEEGVLQESTRVFCSGSSVFYNRAFRCYARQGHGYMDLESAIAKSCNIFFYELGRKMGISKIAKHAQELGFGHVTGLDLPAERTGIMPTPEWKRKARGTQWYAGETISVSIGQGAVTATPIQLLRAVSAIAMDGQLATPHLLLGLGNQFGGEDWKLRTVEIRPEFARRIREGMWNSVNNWGTGFRAAVPGADVCGKTGTVQVIGRERKRELALDSETLKDHAWFVGFAPKDNPEIAVAAFLEHAGGGGVAAAPLAKEIFRAYFESQRKREFDMTVNQKIASLRP